YTHPTRPPTSRGSVRSSDSLAPPAPHRRGGGTPAPLPPHPCSPGLALPPARSAPCESCPPPATGWGASPKTSRHEAPPLPPPPRTGSISGSKTGSTGGTPMADTLERAVEASEIVDALKSFGVTQVDVAAVTQVSDRAVR